MSQMRPKTAVIRSKKWLARSFYLNVPMRTNSAEVLKAGTVVTTTGELTKSRWFVCIIYPVIYKHGIMFLEVWLRRKDLLNPTLAHSTGNIGNYKWLQARQKARGFKQTLRKIENYKPLHQPS